MRTGRRSASKSVNRAVSLRPSYCVGIDCKGVMSSKHNDGISL